uniref:Uncharacterized protein n=1 Tax=Anguilla anguilla TaxID=7936 RepID=A0A0E9XHK1_ANGAN
MRNAHGIDTHTHTCAHKIHITPLNILFKTKIILFIFRFNANSAMQFCISLTFLNYIFFPHVATHNISLFYRLKHFLFLSCQCPRGYFVSNARTLTGFSFKK